MCSLAFIFYGVFSKVKTGIARYEREFLDLFDVFVDVARAERRAKR